MTTAVSKPKRLSVDEKMALFEKARKIHNPMPLKERIRICDLADEAEERGDLEEAHRLLKKIPVEWHMAMVVIEQYGSKKLLDMGLDLSYAIAVLGEDFVYDD